MTATTLNAPTANEGAMYYDQSAQKIKYYNGSFWQVLAANSDFTCATNWIAVPADSTLGPTRRFRAVTLTSTMENAANAYSAASCEIRGTGAGRVN